MKKINFILIFIGLILVSVIAGTIYYIGIQKETNEQDVSIIDVFNSSGAKMIVNEMYFFSRATDDYKDLDALSKVCEDVFNAIEIKNFSTNSTSTDNLLKKEILGSTKDGVKVSAMASIVGNNSDAGDKYITIDATGTEKVNALFLREKVEDIFNKHGLDVTVNSCITGTYDGNVEDTQLEKICRNILNESDAEKVDSKRFENVISVSAFSPVMKDKLSINGKNVNLSIAIRYNKQEDKTYLWVATPIVNTEY
ncbi:YwmB family TATA-box binding protein [Ruminiclostridium herbifermentans]|uniref:YwmB family TATA-box binding protein n=1 Tax=Ruminiclostridium herbifermentans TaxID=2488810 RepID=A0A4U7JHU9_9FIRM|nr:YwmB family TATA-box binding protein [Ruminiclostridium herbifermentans]QNU66643.1 YwmB family TATA-box binding protein [Ruminiclostridium herbifermentans]